MDGELGEELLPLIWNSGSRSDLKELRVDVEELETHEVTSSIPVVDQ